ncbi:SixA phosphatase family protein [Nocardioides sp. B-3]|uniref:SixA phosphatase family protein n=1 Tax=Nocardioides sp. B-3 TaxID=2895565 RepID=UPI002152AFDA|nr:histidine phosphatase family protein [Nocardioides sp. B-3]UUZ59377.1 histidine phosphatase family protein [Nocardioides sp. B-3]
MRHAKSDWSGDEPDLLRPIGARGRRQAAEAGRWLSSHLPALDVVVTSPAKRARSTWKVAGAAYSGKPVVDTDERIYTMDDADLLAVLREIDDDISSTLMVGHNPGLDELVARLTGEQVDMVTSSLAVMRLRGRWRDLAKGSCVLENFGRPPG